MKRRIILITIIGILLLAVHMTAGAEEPFFSGSCGENITYSLDDTGVLTITGTGPITSHIWNDYYHADIADKIKSVYISDGITEIPEYAFESCMQMRSARIPGSVKRIGKYAFNECFLLSDVQIPEGITTIEKETFCQCVRLESITIPESVIYIEDAAFAASGLKEVMIPANVKRLGSSVFYYCEELEKVTLPDGIEEIGESCFSATKKLKSLTVPDHTTIDLAIMWPGKVFTHIGSNAAKTMCRANYDLSWRTFYDPRYPNCELGYRVERNDEDELIISDLEITGVDKGTTTVVIPDGVTRVADQAFKLNEEITKVVFPDSLTSIGSEAFYMCSYITHFEFPKNLKRIEDGAFDYCRFLVNPIFPDSLEYIGEYAFISCYNIENLTIPKKVKEIKACAFKDLCALKSVTLPEGLEKIGRMAFCSCDILPEIFVPDSVTEIDADAFLSSPVKIYANRNTNGAKSVSKAGYTFREPRTKFDMKYLYDGDRITGLAVTGADNTIASLTLPPEVTVINEQAFSNCSRLESITIQDKVTEIGDYAFVNCSRLSRIAFMQKKNTQVTISNTAFNGVSGPEVYCYANSSAESYAVRKGWNVHLLDGSGTVQKLTLEGAFGLAVGSSRKVIVDVLPANAEITWSSNNTDAVTVQDGVVTAHAPGRAVITARAGTKTDTVIVTAYNPVESFELDATEVWTVAFNQPVCRAVNKQPSDAIISLNWFSDDTTIATVENGVVTTLYPGDVVISATDSFSGVTASILLHVCYPVSRIDLSADPAKILPGQTTQVTANVTMRKTSCVNHLVTFSSSNTDVATVNREGKVTGKAPGYAIISATAIPFSDIYPEKPEPAKILIEVMEVCCVTDGVGYGHDWSETEYEWLENDTKVKATRTCSRNPQHTETETAAVTSRVTKQPSCTEKGETTYTSAAFRNLAFKAQEKTLANIPETGHEWNDPVYEWNSEGTQVTATRTCKHNPDHKETETKGLAGSEVTKESGCEEMGETTYTSAAFDNPAFQVQHYTLTDVAPLGHHEVIDEPAKDPTCTETGMTVSSHCDRCGTVLKTPKKIPMVPHEKEVDQPAREATCTETGCTEGAHCPNCGTVLSVSEEIPMVPHVKEVDEPEKAATCTEPGRTEAAHCAVCGTVLSTAADIPALDHKWGTPTYHWSKDYSTCTAEQVCEHDNTHVRTEEGTVTSETTPATKEADGKTVYTAVFTDEAYTEQTKEVIIPKPAPPVMPAPGASVGEYRDPKGTGWYFIHKEGPATFLRPEKPAATVKIPDSIKVNGKTVKVTSIGDNAFKNDKKLTTITIGANVTAIGQNAFASCTKLKTVKGGKYIFKVKNGAFSGCRALKKLPKLEKVQLIGTDAFKDCVKIKEITLGKSLKEIGKNAFKNCRSLKKITVKSTKLKDSNVKSGAFKGINAKATIKCPKKKLKDYRKLFVKKGAPKTVTFK